MPEGDDPTRADEEWRYFKKQPKFVDNKKNPHKVKQPREKRKEEGEKSSGQFLSLIVMSH
jgi:hypothetical protein